MPSGLWAAFQRWCAATIPRLPLTNCAAAAAALLTTITAPCWTTMASAPPASIPARAMKTASPSTPTTPQGRHRPSPHPAGQPRFRHRRRLRQLRPADGGETQSPGTGEAGAGGAYAPCPQPRCRNTQLPVQGAQVVHHPAGHATGPHRQGGSVCTPTGWKCTTRATGWNGWRVRGEGEANVNYRHVIGSLVRKPGAFARYRFREQLFPTMHFRLTYGAAAVAWGACRWSTCAFWAATTMAATVDSAPCCWRRVSPSTTRRCGTWPSPEAPALGQPDLKIYDRLLTWSRRGCAHDGHQRDAAASARNSS